MVVRRQKKVRKQRGSRVHGYGRISGGHRASGSRGGVGQAGKFKHHVIRSIKMGILDEKGMTRHQSLLGKIKPINILNVNQLVSNQAEKLGKKDNKYILDLSTLGYNKLLGKGSINYPVAISVMYATEKAVSKIEEAGGSVTLLSEEEE